MVFTPGGTHKFFEELAPVARAANPDRAAIAAVSRSTTCRCSDRRSQQTKRHLDRPRPGNGRGDSRRA